MTLFMRGSTVHNQKDNNSSEIETNTEWSKSRWYIQGFQKRRPFRSDDREDKLIDNTDFKYVGNRKSFVGNPVHIFVLLHSSNIFEFEKNSEF